MKTIQGSIPAILTPMQDDGALDLTALQRLLDWHIAEGSDGVVVVGTTGESPTVNYAEHCALIETTVKHVAGRIPVIAGTGANSTAEAIELAHFARGVAGGRLGAARAYVKALPDWFAIHLATMDGALAGCLKRG